MHVKLYLHSFEVEQLKFIIMLKLSGTTEKLLNSELLLLSLAVSHYIQRHGAGIEHFKAFKNLDNKLRLLVKGNTHTHYKISINGTDDRLLTEEDVYIEEVLNSFLKEK